MRSLLNVQGHICVCLVELATLYNSRSKQTNLMHNAKDENGTRAVISGTQQVRRWKIETCPVKGSWDCGEH